MVVSDSYYIIIASGVCLAWLIGLNGIWLEGARSQWVLVGAPVDLLELDLGGGGCVEAHLDALLPLADVLGVADLDPALAVELPVGEVAGVLREVVAPGVGAHAVLLAALEAAAVDGLRGDGVVLIAVALGVVLLAVAGLLALALEVPLAPAALPLVRLGGVLALPVDGVFPELALVDRAVAVGHLPQPVLLAAAEAALVGDAVHDDLAALPVRLPRPPLALVLEDHLVEVQRGLNQPPAPLEPPLPHLALVVGAVVEDEDRCGVRSLRALHDPIVVAAVAEFDEQLLRVGEHVFEGRGIERFAVEFEGGALGDAALFPEVLQRALFVLLDHGPFVHLCYERFAHIYYSLYQSNRVNPPTVSLSSPLRRLNRRGGLGGRPSGERGEAKKEILVFDRGVGLNLFSPFAGPINLLQDHYKLNLIIQIHIFRERIQN